MIWKWKKMRCPKNNLRGQEVEKIIRRGWKSKQRIVSHPNIKKDIKEATVENVDIIRILLIKYIHTHRDYQYTSDNSYSRNRKYSKSESRSERDENESSSIDNSLIIYLWMIKDNSSRP
jgi:hypothetical protein